MSLERVSVQVDGAAFADWEKVTVHAGIKDKARSCVILMNDRPGAPVWPVVFKSGAKIVVKAGGDLSFTGFVDNREPRLTPENFKVTISARSKAQDAIDSSVDHTKPDYVNTHVAAVAQDQDAFGVGYSIDFKPDNFARWRPNPGHTLFESLEPLCQEEGATMFGQPDGSVKITRAGANPPSQSGALIEGVNLWKMGATFDESGQHSKITEHGQSYKGNGGQAIAISASANNDNVTRTRPLHHHHDRDTDRGRLTKRAKRRRDAEQGEGIRAHGQTRGWRDTGGMLWTPGNKVFVKSPSLALTQDMLIESVAYDQDGKNSGGTIAHLSLVDPRAHGGKGGGVNKSGQAWGFDDSEAS